MNLPPLNQTQWALLIASLSAGAGWLMIVLSARMERMREERHRDLVDGRSKVLDLD